uniref:Uncharacterized protein n=1 Tax=Pristionchus pacificus TaxID=54126 RepID=A0A2A6BC08_PRIPA|eukprot:PDM63409.1 hypothetical protein PRIPAC_53766 [Pristionchus pacificus]
MIGQPKNDWGEIKSIGRRAELENEWTSSVDTYVVPWSDVIRVGVPLLEQNRLNARMNEDGSRESTSSRWDSLDERQVSTTMYTFPSSLV